MALVNVVRIYFNETEANIKKVLNYLHDDIKVKGATVFRGIAGFGQSGEMHQSTLVDIDMDLPIVIEFFDEPTKVETALEAISTMLEPGHVLQWTANDNN